MKCPFCSHAQDKVVDSREATDGNSIRRRRECLKCERRFTAYEEVQDLLPMVIKKDGRRENFKREKILQGLQNACQKRPIATESLEVLIADIEKRIMEKGEKEIRSHDIGEMVVSRLKSLDEVAYIRFASVYKDFRDREAFLSELSQYFKK